MSGPEPTIQTGFDLDDWDTGGIGHEPLGGPEGGTSGGSDDGDDGNGDDTADDGDDR